MAQSHIIVVGAGIVGLWQAFELVRRGHRVTVREAMPEAATGAASRFAGAMIAPYCEAEAAPAIVERLGLRGLEMWQQAFPGISCRGSLVIAARRDTAELHRFARLTRGHRWVDAQAIAALEPDFGSRFERGLHYPGEAHMQPRAALAFLIDALRMAGADLRFGDPVPDPIWLSGAAGEPVIDARGLAARGDLPELRGVRGEMVVVSAPDVTLSRPVRLLHPRIPLYVVPWGGGTFMIGATAIESEDGGAVSVRSALELLGAAYVVHPAFAQARIVELSAGVRPAFPDNVPRIIARGRRIFVNGVYRHGFLLAPVLAKIVADHLEKGDVAAGGVLAMDAEPTEPPRAPPGA